MFVGTVDILWFHLGILIAIYLCMYHVYSGTFDKRPQQLYMTAVPRAL